MADMAHLIEPGALAKRHVDYGVKAADYTPVGAALLWTLEQGLGLR
jgi:hemoglobin-like flavoprotein